MYNEFVVYMFIKWLSISSGDFVLMFYSHHKTHSLFYYPQQQQAIINYTTADDGNYINKQIVSIFSVSLKLLLMVVQTL